MAEYKSGCECTEDKFRAEARTDGDRRLVKVSGTCTCEQTGYALVLLQDNEGTPGDPSDIRLRLIIQRAPFPADVVTETPVREVEYAVDAQVRRVVISVPGQERLVVQVSGG